MSSDQPKTILNTRQRFTSSDYNKQVALHDRNLQEAMRRVLGGDADLSGVISGLAVSIPGGSLDVAVSAGLGLIFDGSFVAPDSQHRWLELLSTTAVTAATADATNPRWDVVEIAAGVASTGLFSRDQFDPATSGVNSVSVSVEEQPAPTVTIRSGTPAANPVFPDGVANVIPLAYVYVPATATALTVDAVIHCRPLLRTRRDLGGSVTQPDAAQVQGGGLACDGSGTLAVRGVRGAFTDSRHSFSVSGDIPFVEAVNEDANASPMAGDGVVFAYAYPPPFPSGYTVTMAQREFAASGTLAASQFSGFNESSYGALVVFSTSAPTDLNDPIGASTGTGGPREFAFAAATSDRTKWIYLGATYFKAGGFKVFLEQFVESGAEIVMGGTAPEILIKTDAPGAGLITLWESTASAPAFDFPPTAFVVNGYMIWEWTTPANTKDGFIKMIDKTTIFKESNLGSVTHTAGSSSQADYHSMRPNPANGEVTLSFGTGTTGEFSEFKWVSASYVDSILGAR